MSLDDDEDEDEPLVVELVVEVVEVDGSEDAVVKRLVEASSVGTALVEGFSSVASASPPLEGTSVVSVPG